MMPRRLIVGVFLAAAACAPRACDDRDDRMARDVATLVGASSSLAHAAAERLIPRGRAAIVLLESGLYEAEPAGRRRIVQVLVRIGHPDAAPILRHLATHDPSEAVRVEARRGLTALAAP